MKLIDIGGFNGDSALHFISYPDITSIDVYEPNLDYQDIWLAIEKHYPNIRFIPHAVYTHNGGITYHQRPDDNPLGSTIMEAKIQTDEATIKNIPCVDILDIVPDEPYCLKVDAEGAEYDILERLITKGKPNNVDRLYVEWHDSKMTSDNFAKQVAIINHFGKRMKAWL
jgi:FkbM family methyltransferase